MPRYLRETPRWARRYFVSPLWAIRAAASPLFASQSSNRNHYKKQVASLSGAWRAVESNPAVTNERYSEWNTSRFGSSEQPQRIFTRDNENAHVFRQERPAGDFLLPHPARVEHGLGRSSFRRVERRHALLLQRHVVAAEKVVKASVDIGVSVQLVLQQRGPKQRIGTRGRTKHMPTHIGRGQTVRARNKACSLDPVGLWKAGGERV